MTYRKRPELLNPRTRYLALGATVLGLMLLVLGCSVAPDSLVHIENDRATSNLKKHVTFLASPESQGRLTGTPGEERAANYVAQRFAEISLAPAASDNQNYLETFSFFAGVSLGAGSELSLLSKNKNPQKFTPPNDWLPVALSRTGKFNAAPIVFVGYGIVIPTTEQVSYDSYQGLDVKNKWVLAFRFSPEKASGSLKQTLARYSNIRDKATFAREHGALGLIVVSGPNSQAKDQLIPLTADGLSAQTSIGVISVSDAVASSILGGSPNLLKHLQDSLDYGIYRPGFAVDQKTLSATVTTNIERKTGHNVLGRLIANDPCELVVVSAHIDHLGKGRHPTSLARNLTGDQIHFGADDNASGVSVMLETARVLASYVQSGRLSLQRDIVFAAWSGEEIGLLGSTSALDEWSTRRDPIFRCVPKIVANINLDMVGRMTDKIIVDGLGSSPWWKKQLKTSNALLSLPLKLEDDPETPTDSLVFFQHSIPALTIWTGAHPDYHTPTDTVDKLNIPGMGKVLTLSVELTRRLAQTPDPINFTRPTRTPATQQSASSHQMRVRLGTIPDYSAPSYTGSGELVLGVRLSGVTPGTPAHRSGIQAGDIITNLNKLSIENIYDYTEVINNLTIGKPVPIQIKRAGRLMELSITPESR